MSVIVSVSGVNVVVADSEILSVNNGLFNRSDISGNLIWILICGFFVISVVLSCVEDVSLVSSGDAVVRSVVCIV